MWGRSLDRETEVANTKFILKSRRFNSIIRRQGPRCLAVKFTSIHAMGLRQGPKIREGRIIVMRRCARLTKGPLSKRIWWLWITQKPNQIFLYNKWKWCILLGSRRGCLINPLTFKSLKLTTIANSIEIQSPLNFKMKINFEALEMMSLDKEWAKPKTALSLLTKLKITTRGYSAMSPAQSKWPR